MKQLLMSRLATIPGLVHLLDLWMKFVSGITSDQIPKSLTITMFRWLGMLQAWSPITISPKGLDQAWLET